MYCKGDPRVPEFYQRRWMIAVETARLKSRGTEKKGLTGRVLAKVNTKVAKVVGTLVQKEEEDKENVGSPSASGNPPVMRKKRHSADRDMAASILSPRKRRRTA